MRLPVTIPNDDHIIEGGNEKEKNEVCKTIKLRVQNGVKSILNERLSCLHAPQFSQNLNLNFHVSYKYFVGA